ncbi:MAG TPA: AMP-binding protein, partial [Burkholderiales bacterium]|nr:AMP-binding protein [Burkholderiales bacterium]
MKTWTGRVPALRPERHFERPAQCFVERPGGLVQMLEEAAARNPEGEALVCGETRLSWRALRARVAAAAGALVRRGIGPGDRVALLLGNRIEFPLAFLG